MTRLMDESCVSTELLPESAPLREFTIVHELLHLIVPNHGKLFKSNVERLPAALGQASEGRTDRTCGSHELRTHREG